MPDCGDYPAVCDKLLLSGFLSNDSDSQKGKIQAQKIIAKGDKPISENVLGNRQNKDSSPFSRPPKSCRAVSRVFPLENGFAQYTILSLGFKRDSRIRVQEKSLEFNRKDERKSDRHGKGRMVIYPAYRCAKAFFTRIVPS
jgi:hypothetical protein